MHANFVHLGYLHIPIFSVFLAAGLIAALLLGQRTAPVAGLSPQTMWDTGLAAAISAFVISRVLLIATNLKSFLSYPRLVLTLPSFTASGILLTGAFLFTYLHRKHLRIASVLDASAAPIALLWAILSLGRFVSGSTGMPTAVPWAVQDAVLGPIHPFELYTALAAFALCAILLRAMPAGAEVPGKTAATALFIAGSLLFLLDFVSQPADSARVILLDPVQWVGLGLLLVGAFGLLTRLAPAPARDVRPVQHTSPHAL